jgi:hypothetical protein
MFKQRKIRKLKGKIERLESALRTWDQIELSSSNFFPSDKHYIKLQIAETEVKLREVQGV